MKPSNILFAFGLSLGMAATTVTYAASSTVSITNREISAQALSRDYWTGDRLAQASEMTLVPNGGFYAQQECFSDLAVQSETSAQSSQARKPLVAIAPQLTNRLFEPVSSNVLTAYSSDVQTDDAGTFRAHFSSNRVLKPSRTVYPYRTVGKLYFTIPGVGDAWCSASVVQARLIATAGHCVADGGGNWYTNFRFMPALDDGVAPFSTWNWTAVHTTNTWFSGGGGVPNAADYAIIELGDQVISGTLRRTGEITGWLGWRTLALSSNHLHMLGYPGNFDAGNKMHEVTAGSSRATTSNTVEYGSDMRGGSSGGPWVQNFGAVSSGQSNTGRNQVTGVTSYGYVSTDPKVQGASTFDTRFSNMFQQACARQAGNCL